MSEEKKLILNMLKEGKITEDEALKLLDAIGTKNKNESEHTEYKEEDFEKKLENSAKKFTRKVLEGVETILNFTGDALNNIDIDSTSDLINMANLNKYKGKTSRHFSFEISPDSDIFIKNKNGKIQVFQSNDNILDITANINFDEKYHKVDDEFLITRIENNQYYIGIDDNKNNNQYEATIILTIPKNFVKNIKIENKNSKITADNLNVENIYFETSNSKIIVDSIKANNIFAKTTNAKIEIYDVNSELLDIKTTNGKISLNNIISNDVITNTTNGKIELINIDSKTVSAKNTNGSISLERLGKSANNVVLNSTNGGIYISFADDIKNRGVKAVLKGRNSENLSSQFEKIIQTGNTTEATSSNFNNSEDDLIIEASTSNGKIAIN